MPQRPSAPPSAHSAILGIGTALPPFAVSQELAAQWVIDAVHAAGPGEDRRALARDEWIRRTFTRVGVERRYTVSGPRGAVGGHGTIGAIGTVGTAERMAIYREHAAPLAACAARRALSNAGIAAGDVTHLVVVTCTGFYAPGPDVDLIALLGLQGDVDRTLIGFMGCYGAFAGLRNASRTVAADSRAVVLVVCVELCSIHMRGDGNPGSLVAHAIFGDGAAACVVGGASAARSGFEPLMELGPAASRIAPGTKDLMSWTIGNEGFEMTLAPGCPAKIGDALTEFVRPLVGDGAPHHWLVHPGGPAILAAAETALGLPDDALTASRDVLRDSGNVSSATILFVMERALPAMAVGARGVALGFGPGLTLEGFAFTRGARVLRPLATVDGMTVDNMDCALAAPVESDAATEGAVP